MNKITYLKLLTSAFLWGGTFVAAKIVTKDAGPFSAAFLRFAIASVFLAALSIRADKGIVFFPRNKIFIVAVLGFTGIFSYNFCFFSGLKYIEAGRASVIVANNPVFIALFSAILFSEKLTFAKLTGIFISVTGALIVVTQGDLLKIFQGGIGIGELFIFGTVASWVVYSLTGKAFLTDFTPLQTVTYSVLAGTLFLFFPAAAEGLFEDIFLYSPVQWASLFYLGFFGTVTAFVFYYSGIKQIGPTRAGLFINFVPVSAVLISFVVLGEPLTFSLLTGLIFVSTGVYITNRNSFKIFTRN
ncbi:MAG: DMT family transporter [Thermodesulfobacteriota bacterium]